MTTVDELAQTIRQVDGNNTLGAGSLAEAILAKLPHLAARQPVEQSVEEDVYCAIADMIEPYVQREGINPDGALPASVHDSVSILLDHWIKTRQPVGQEPVAWMTHHDEPMLFPTAAETAAYCEDDEQPVPLFRSPTQAVDLGQFRVAVMHAYGLIENNEMRAKLGELLDLIDSSKAVQP